MDQAFACPDCGTTVQIKRLAPGRQVRCGFCHRLLEVPYLPRVATPGWKRRRYQRPWWVVWSWAALALLGVLILAAAAVRFVGHQARLGLMRSIERLVASADEHEHAGRFGQAVLDLDTAIQLGTSAGGSNPEQLDAFRSRRQTLVRKDAQSLLDRLHAAAGAPFPMGDWLGLEARVAADPDLTPLRQPVADQFRRSLCVHIETALAEASSCAHAGDASKALEHCERAAPLAVHLDESERSRLQAEADRIVRAGVESQGIVVEPPRGQFLAGSIARYNKTMVPALLKMLRARGYLPQPEKSPWKDLWSAAPYRLRLELREQNEGNYMASKNRLTRIDARLKLFLRSTEIWQSTPTARTRVPLPNLPGYYSARVALSPERIEEFERLLYDDARAQIDEKFSFALNNMPACERQLR